MTERLHFHSSLSFIGEGNGNPLQCSCLENPRDGGAWWAAVYGVTQSQTRLKWLSSSSILLLLLCFMYKSEYIVDLVCNLFTWSVIFTAFILHFLCLKIKILDLKKRSLYYSVCGCFIKYLRNKLLGSDVQNCLHNSFSRLSRSCFLTNFSFQSHVGFQR